MKKIFALAIIAILTVCTMLALASTAFAADVTTAVDNKTTVATTAATTAAATTAATTAVAGTTAAATTAAATTARVTEVNATTVEGQTYYVDGTTTLAGNQESVDEPIVQTGSASSIAVFSLLAIAGAAFIVTKSKKED